VRVTKATNTIAAKNPKVALIEMREVGGAGAEDAHDLGVAFAGDADGQFVCADVDSGHVGLDAGQPFKGADYGS
jgi:hypothetical protein